MQIGSLVKTKDGRLGIIKSYHPMTTFAWYVYMMDSNWNIEYFQDNQLEVISV